MKNKIIMNAIRVKSIIAIAFVFFFQTSFSQKITHIDNYGLGYTRMEFDSMMRIPLGLGSIRVISGHDTGQLRYYKTDSSVYVHTGSQWLKVGGSSSGVQSVTGLNTDNTDPLNPVVNISVDGSTITGSGTPGDPLVAATGATPTLQSVTTAGNTTSVSTLYLQPTSHVGFISVEDAAGSPTGGSVQIGINGANNTSGYLNIINNVSGTPSVKLAGDSTTHTNTLQLPDTSGELAARVKVNGTTYSPARNGTIDLGTISGGSTAWDLNGNTATDTSFIGPTNSKPLAFKSYNTKAGLIGLTNTFFGKESGSYNTITGVSNTGMGLRSLGNLTSGINNTGLGVDALLRDSSGSQNVAVGHHSMIQNLTGNYNTAVGNESMYNNLGSANTALGFNSAQANTTGNYNTSLGYISLQDNDNGSNNIAIGARSAENLKGSSNTIIGGFTNLFYTPNINNNVIIADGDGSRKISFDSLGQAKFNQYTTGNFEGGSSDDSVMVITSDGTIKKRNSSAFGGSGTDSAAIHLPGGITSPSTYVLQFSNLNGDTTTVTIDTSGLSTPYINGLAVNSALNKDTSNHVSSTGFNSAIAAGTSSTMHGNNSFMATEFSTIEADCEAVAIVSGSTHYASNTTDTYIGGTGNSSFDTRSTFIFGIGSETSNSSGGALVGGSVNRLFGNIGTVETDNAILAGVNNTIDSSSNNSVIIGGQVNTIDTGSINSAIIGGTTNNISLGVDRVILLGKSSYAATRSNTTYVDSLDVSGKITLAGTAISSTATQLNYLNAATGTTGTGSVVYSASPTFTGTVTIPTLSLSTTISGAGTWTAGVINTSSNITGNNIVGLGLLRSAAGSTIEHNGRNKFAATSDGFETLTANSGSANSAVLSVGALRTGYVAKTANYTATAFDEVISCSTNAFTITLPTAVGCAGQKYWITNSTAANTITIGTTSSQTFANVTATPTSISLVGLGSVGVVSDGANWLQLK